MKDIRHDIESYIITINRKGQQSAVPQTARPAASLMKLSAHASDPCDLHEPQASYPAEAGMAHEPSPSGTTTDITAPLPGIIIGLTVNVGDTVSEGQELAVLEAMKMENSIQSPSSGTVQTVNVSVGDTVSEGTVILTVSL